MDCPDPDRRQHRDDRLDRCRHIDRQAVAFTDPQAAKAGGDSLDLGEQLGIRERASPTALVERDQRPGVASTGRDVAIERVEGEVRVAAREPGEARTLAELERAFRSPRPIETLGGLEPEHVGVAQRALVQLVVAPSGLVGRDVPHRKSSIDPMR